jgi:sugar (pentulose or hexulose) kinase
MDNNLGIYLGIDFGTSGARAIAIAANQEIVQSIKIPISVQTPQVWREVLFELLSALAPEIRQNLRAIAINGTSGTVLLCDAAGHPLTEALLYNDDRGRSQLAAMDAFVPAHQLVRSASSSLAKLLWFQAQGIPATAKYFLHQADWLGALLHGKWGVSDYHNALKLGFDVAQLAYPRWLRQHPLLPLLPQVVAPGSAIAPILPQLAQALHIHPACQIHAGTTDSIAAFIASGASQIGDAVTSLGSTLVLKLLSVNPINDLPSGVYSHRFGNLWLTGGASNTGGAVLKHFFDEAMLQKLSAEIDPHQPSDLDYYPLLQPGDRFPINDPNLPPRLEPRPSGDRQFLHGLLTGITKIEVLGYETLQSLGASPLKQVFTAGGGAQNATWTTMRAIALNCPVLTATNPEAAYGNALLAQRGSLETWAIHAATDSTTP